MNHEPQRQDSPEDSGIPSYADDTSSAYDSGARPSFEDPYALPGDEAAGVDEFGTTPAEQAQGDSLDRRITREAPESPDDLDLPPDEQIADEPPYLYDDEIGRTVGRLISPDEGRYPDQEGESVAYDSGEREGLSAEEAAMHTVSGDEVPFD